MQIWLLCIIIGTQALVTISTPQIATKLGQLLQEKSANMATDQKVPRVSSTLDEWQELFLSIATGIQLLVTISTQLPLQRLGPLLLGKLDSMDMSVKGLLAIASPVLFLERSLSIATGVQVVIIFTPPMWQRLEQQLLDKWGSMDIGTRVWPVMSFPTMNEIVDFIFYCMDPWAHIKRWLEKLFYTLYIMVISRYWWFL